MRGSKRLTLSSGRSSLARSWWSWCQRRTGPAASVQQLGGPTMSRWPGGEAEVERLVPRKELAAHDVAFDAVVAVAELAGDAERGGVVLEGAGGGVLCSEPFEGQVQHRGAHLGSDPLPLVAASQPGTGAHLAQHREVTAADALRAGYRTVADHGEFQRPVRGCPGGPAGPVVLHRAAGALIGRDIGPGGRERLDVGVVHAEGGEVGEGVDVIRAGVSASPRLSS
jgi:hypothetical protein